MAFSQTCPYGPLKDAVVGETTCDAKKKAWDLLGFDVLEVPQKKNPIDRQLWLEEVLAFKRKMEDMSGNTITADRLSESIALVNRKRRALQRINAFRKHPQPPISGLDALLVSQVALNQDIQGFIADAEALAEELEERVEKGISAYPESFSGKRVMLAGTPSPRGSAKVHHIVERSGLMIVVDESCTGTRYYRDLTDEHRSGLDAMIEAVADRYFAIDCACFSPNDERLRNLKELAREYRVDGVIQNILQYCHGYNIEARRVEEVFNEIGIPSLKIVTDFSQEDAGQIRTRVEAFAELLEERS